MSNGLASIVIAHIFSEVCWSIVIKRVVAHGLFINYDPDHSFHLRVDAQCSSLVGSTMAQLKVFFCSSHMRV